MKRFFSAVLLGLTSVGWSAPSEDATVVKLGEISATAPKGWKEEAPSSSFRAYQFRLAGTKKEDSVELVIFRGIGGSGEANIARWKNQFMPPEGKKLDDVAKVTKTKVGGHPALYLDVTGTFSAQPNVRMLGIQIDGLKQPYHLILRGPAATVEKHKKDFDGWLKAFK